MDSDSFSNKDINNEYLITCFSVFTKEDLKELFSMRATDEHQASLKLYRKLLYIISQKVVYSALRSYIIPTYNKVLEDKTFLLDEILHDPECYHYYINEEDIGCFIYLHNTGLDRMKELVNEAYNDEKQDKDKHIDK